MNSKPTLLMRSCPILPCITLPGNSGPHRTSRYVCAGRTCPPNTVANAFIVLSTSLTTNEMCDSDPSSGVLACPRTICADERTNYAPENGGRDELRISVHGG